MPARARSLNISAILLALLASAMGACASNSDASPEHCDAAGESEDAVASTSSALVSSVDCTPRVETAYVSGVPRPITTIRIGGKAVTKATGHAFLAMQRAADAAGVYLGLTSGFRTMAEQRYLWGCYNSKKCNGGNLAAEPGYSNHQSGIAVDVTTSSWLAANAGRFGFVRTVPSEPWHYEYFGSDPGGVCDTVSWVSPRDGGWYKNGVWLKAKAAGSTRVVYEADGYKLGESSDASQDFALRYTFLTLGDRNLTATAYNAKGAALGSSSIRIKVVE